MQLDASHHRELHSRTPFVKICFYTVWLLTGSKQQHHTNKFNVLAENRNLVRCFFFGACGCAMRQRRTMGPARSGVAATNTARFVKNVSGTQQQQQQQHHQKSPGEAIAFFK